MKQVILILGMLYSFQLTAQVPYTSFQFESSNWQEYHYQVFFNRSYYDVFVEGDTTIFDVQYYKLRREGKTYYYDDPSQIEIVDSMEFSEYLGAIRENDQKRVEFVILSDSS